mmetsp:Transcript_24999/g.49915  ORF Transcript_24999/g.49915 Transcript_24999/m.49915 type:complete len:160 (+) Transcript_24999:125-604(+)
MKSFAIAAAIYYCHLTSEVVALSSSSSSSSSLRPHSAFSASAEWNNCRPSPWQSNTAHARGNRRRTGLVVSSCRGVRDGGEKRRVVLSAVATASFYDDGADKTADEEVNESRRRRWSRNPMRWAANCLSRSILGLRLSHDDDNNNSNRNNNNNNNNHTG